MTRALPCDTLSKDTRSDSPPQVDIRVIMGGLSAAPTLELRWVYFAERDGLVKIGYSANVPQRMHQLGTRLLAVMPGGERMERRMHGLFAEYRVQGEREWFHPGLGLVGFIEALLGDNPYVKTPLPEEYGRAESARLTAQQRADNEAERLREASRMLTVAPSAIDREEDRRAAAVIGAVLARQVAS